MTPTFERVAIPAQHLGRKGYVGAVLDAVMAHPTEAVKVPLSVTTCANIANMRSAIASAARGRGVHVCTQLTDDAVIVWLRKVAA